MDTTIKNEAPKHWASSLEKNDYVVATIRHKTDGEKNLCDVLCKVLDNDTESEKVWLHYKRQDFEVKYCELTDISKLVNNGKIIEFLEENIERCKNTEHHYKMVAKKRSSDVNWAMGQAYKNVLEFIKNQKLCQ